MLFGIAIAIVIAGSVVPLTVEALKIKKIKKEIEHAELTVTTRLFAKIFLLAMAVLVFFGGLFVTVYCSIKIEAASKAEYTAVMILIIAVTLLCFYLFVGLHYYVRVATDEGILVCFIFTKTKFYRYEEITRLSENTVFKGNRSFYVYSENGKKIFSLLTRRDKKVWEMIALLRKRSPRLKHFG